MPAASALNTGQVVAVHGRQYAVDIAGEIVSCFTRGKKSLVACGDVVEVLRTGPGQGVIEATGERRSLLYRSDMFREKLIAANVDQIIVVLAAVPSFYRELLDRCLIAAEHQHIEALIVLNKSDLAEETSAALDRLAVYESLGYVLRPLSARRDIAPLQPHLAGRLSVLVGQSGMGKSTIVNALAPHAQASVGEISAALDSGRHTTTHARLYRLGADAGLIDSPGMQEFGLHHIPARALQFCFPEFRGLLGECRFNDCAHLREPGCAVRAALQRGAIEAERMRTYERVMQEALRPDRY